MRLRLRLQRLQAANTFSSHRRLEACTQDWFDGRLGRCTREIRVSRRQLRSQPSTDHNRHALESLLTLTRRTGVIWRRRTRRRSMKTKRRRFGLRDGRVSVDSTTNGVRLATNSDTADVAGDLRPSIMVVLWQSYTDNWRIEHHV